MQSVAGSNNLECADCKTSFTSASLLLKHFAEHIIEQASDTELSFSHESANSASTKKSRKSLLQAKKKERKESILETVLRQSAVQCKMIEKLPPLSSLQNDMTCCSNTSSSDSFKSSISHNCGIRNSGIKSSEQTNELTLPDDMVVEIGQRAKEKHKCSNKTTLIKFDLQKRLENCVSRLALKQECKGVEQTKSSLTSSQPIETALVKNEITKSEEKEVTKKCEREEINPLKICVVTLDEVESKRESGERAIENIANEHCVSKPLKGASNRKQLMPKKIHRPKDDTANVQVLKTDFLSLSDNKISQKPSAKRKYLCHVCSKSFGWSTDLKRHILTHTGERPFKCQLCDATFTRNFLLQKHESRVHILDNIDNRFTQEDTKESIKSNSCSSSSISNNNNNEVEVTAFEKHIVLSGKNQHNKVWKHNRLSDNVNNSLNLKLDKVEQVCDKYAPAKRKLQCDEPSFDHFPQKVFNIL